MGAATLVTNDSMSDYIGRAVERYSSLFKLPTHRTLSTLLFTTCLFIGILIVAAMQSLALYWVALGLVLGAVLFALTIMSDYVIHLVSLNIDQVFTLRRCSALSLYSLLVWLIFTFMGAVVNLFYAGIWFRFFAIGFCVALALRLLVFSATSFAGVARIVLYSAMLPSLHTVPIVAMTFIIGGFLLEASSMLFFSLSIVITAASMFLYVFSINRVGVGILGIDSFSVLRAFMANWTEDQNAPFEQLFDRFGQERDIRVSALSFRNTDRLVKAMMIVPAFHPGPFKNVGSSALPQAIQTALENRLDYCVVSVPHGLSGHDLDLATQVQNQLVIKRVLMLSGISSFGSFATPFVRVKKNGANVGCQAFNGCVLVTLTLAPETMEDLPPQLNAFIIEAAEKCGFSTAITIDAHNSIQGPFEINDAVELLQEAAVEVLKKASKMKPADFQIGVARLTPAEFGLQDGMGPGGIAALVVKVRDKTTAYITIDGNNMISGLRERILSALSKIGVDEGEICTTDTHAVNAVVLNSRGYHPVGEAMDQEILIDYVKQATMHALANLEQAEVGWSTETIPSVKVVGGKQIESMCMLLDKAFRRAKKLALSIFPIVGVILGALLLLL